MQAQIRRQEDEMAGSQRKDMLKDGVVQRYEGKKKGPVLRTFLRQNKQRRELQKAEGAQMW